MSVKIVKNKSRTQSVTFRIDEKVLDSISRLSAKHNISRQKLVEAILKQATEDPDFTLEIDVREQVGPKKKGS